MTSHAVVASVPIVPPGLLATALQAWRGIRGRHVWVAALLGLGSFVVTSTPFWPIAMRDGHLGVLAQAFAAAEMFAFILVGAIVVADRMSDRVDPPRHAHFVALIASVCAATVLHWAFVHYVLGEFSQIESDPGITYESTSTIWRALEWLMVGGVAAAFHSYRRRSLSTAARLREAEANRVAKSRQMIEARLTAMQARVEPQFLFNTLAQVGELHRRDPGRALDMLDRLIDYLRAAMPKMRDTSSTVAQEVELARAYLDIVRLRLGDRLRVSIDVPPEASVARMPPMMLLPLIDHTVVRGLGPASEGGAVRIAAEVAGGRLRLTLVDSGAAIVPDADAEGIAAIRQRLEALYGSDATLDVHRAGGRATEALLDLPLESPSVLNATSDRSAS